jgi:hypothetical protein
MCRWSRSNAAPEQRRSDWLSFDVEARGDGEKMFPPAEVETMISMLTAAHPEGLG